VQRRNDLSQWIAVVLACVTPVMAQSRVDESLASNRASVAEVTFSVPHGLYEEPFDVVLSTKTADAQIWYTLDGTLPQKAPNGQFNALFYDRPVHITGTTCLRAVAVSPDGQDSRVTSCTYIFPGDIPKQFQAPPEPSPPNQSRFPKPPTSPTVPPLDPGVKTALQAIPSVCIVMEPNDFFDPATGINANPSRRGAEWERPASIEWLDPAGRLSFQVNAGLRIHGGVSRGDRTGKHSLRILFKSQYGPAWLEAPLFEDCEVARFDSLVLRMTLHDSWMGSMGQQPQYLRDQFSRDTMRDMGRLTPYGRPMHVYINGLYWGLFILTERPDDGFAAAHLGGSKDQYDALKAKSVSDPDPSVVEVVAGDLTAWDALFGLARAGPEDPASYEQTQQYLDVPSFIDYMLMVFYIGSTDGPAGIGGPPRNFWAVRPREPGGGFVFLSWDLEFSLAGLNENRVTVVGTEDPHYLFHQLAANAEFRMLLADQIHRHFFHEGALTPASATQRYLTRAAEVENALRAEAYRWGQDQKAATMNGLCSGWRNERDRIVRDYLPLRSGIVVEQLRQAGLYPAVEPPVLEVDGVEQNGGTTRSGAWLAMANPNGSGTIYYTTDGSDPRAPCRPVDANELVALVSSEAEKRVLIPETDIGDRWTGGSEPYDDADWADGTPVLPDTGGAVGYTGSRLLDKRISYHVPRMMGRHTSCYVRIPFEIDAADLPRLSHLALRVQCDDGFVAYINGVEAASLNKPAGLAWNSSCVDRPGSGASLWVSIPGHPDLLHPGRNILAVHALDNGSDTFFLLSIELFGSDRSITGGDAAPSAEEYARPVALNESTQIKARVWQNGTWSALTDAVFAVGPVKESLRITEIMYHPAPDDVEFVELANIGPEPINLNRVRFTEGIDFIFPTLVLAPGAATVVVQDTEAFTNRYGPGRNVAGQYSGSLSNAGERIQLRDAAGDTIQDFRYDDAWYDLTDGQGYSLERRDPLHQDPNDLSNSECWQSSPHAGGSPGTLE